MAFDDYGGDCGDVGGDVSADTGGDYASDTGFDDAGYDDSASDFDDTAEIEEDGGDLTDSAEEDISDTDDFAEDTADSDDFSEEDSADTDDFAEDTADSDDFSEEDSADTDDFAEDTADSDDFSEEDSADTDDFAEDTEDSDDFSEEDSADTDDFAEDTADSDDFSEPESEETVDEMEPEASETEETVDEMAPETAETEETGDEIEPETAETEETGDEIEPETAETEETGDEIEPESPESEETGDEIEPEATETEETVDEIEPETAETEETGDEIEPEASETEETVDEIEPETAETEETADTADDSRNLEYREPDYDPEPRDIWADVQPDGNPSAADLNETEIPKDTAPEAQDYIPDYNAIPAQDAAHGFLNDSAFAEETGDGTVDPERLQSFTADTKLEDMTRAEFDALTKADAACAHQILTDYNDRTTAPVDVTQCSRNISMADGSFYTVTDMELTPDRCSLYSAETGDTYQCYPSAQLTKELAEGQQGQNSIGMQNDCGLASTANGVNIVYGKDVTSEQRETQTAKATGNCDLDAKDMGGGIKDYGDCGGTNLDCICRQYENNGLDARGYEGDQIPTMDEIGEQIKNGGTVSLAVNHSLLWDYNEAQDTKVSYLDVLKGRSLQDIRDMKKMAKGKGVFCADHAINLSNAVYNDKGELTHFLVHDTGDGKQKMLSREYLQRALSGEGGIRVQNGGCVFANRRQS